MGREIVEMGGGSADLDPGWLYEELGARKTWLVPF
jgi:hypothetical protein